MKVEFTRQAFPTGGGTVMPAGRVVDLAPDVLRGYPTDAYRRARGARKQAETPRDKQAGTPGDKQAETPRDKQGEMPRDKQAGTPRNK